VTHRVTHRVTHWVTRGDKGKKPSLAKKTPEIIRKSYSKRLANSQESKSQG